MSVIKQLLLILYIQITLTTAQTITLPSNYPNDYSFSLKISPNGWRVFMDIYNTKFILYFPEEDRHYTWPRNFITSTYQIQERNDTTITSYNNAINTKEYICTISFDVMIRLNVYYTTDPIVDKRSYYSIEKNIRQLTIGFDFDVKPNEEDSSLIHTLYNNRLIESKKFSLENKRTMNGKKVTNSIRFGPVRKSLLISYKYHFSTYINTLYNKWGIMFNSILIVMKHNTQLTSIHLLLLIQLLILLFVLMIYIKQLSIL